MIGQVPARLLLFGRIFGLNLIPAFAPPTWMALAFGFEFPATNTVLLARHYVNGYGPAPLCRTP